MLVYLESEEVINLLSDLHGVITPLYDIYASKRTTFMDFEGFMRFCTDFGVFPDVVSKSDCYRVFMNLAFAHESVVTGYDAFNNTRSHFDSRSSIMFQKRGSL